MTLRNGNTGLGPKAARPSPGMPNCRSDGVVQEIALGGLEKDDKELHQLDKAMFSKVGVSFLSSVMISQKKVIDEKTATRELNRGYSVAN